MWPVALSGRLPVKALVSHYPTNKLISRESIQNRRSFPTPTMQQGFLSGISPSFLKLSRSQGQVTHVLLTRSPLEYPRRGLSVRLACVKHAASVRPEPGSNSPYKQSTKSLKTKQKTNPDTKTKSCIRIHKTVAAHQRGRQTTTTPQKNQVLKKLVMMIKATTTTLWHLLRPTQKYIGTLSSSHTTHAHTQPRTPQPAHQHVQQAETLTPQPARRKHTPHRTTQTVKEISTPTTNTTTNQATIP